MAITETISAKLANAALAASSGGVIAAPYFDISSGEMVLYVLGFVCSMIAFTHNEHHIHKSETGWQMFTKASRYIAVGIFAYPSAFVYAGTVWKYSAFQGLSGVIATLSVVLLMDAWVGGRADKLRGGKSE